MHEQLQVKRKSDVFISGFNPSIVLQLSATQSACISNIILRLNNEGKSRKWLSPLPCGIFRIDGMDYKWYDNLLFVEKGGSSAVSVIDNRLKLLTERMTSVIDDPYLLNSNEWSRILSVLETGPNAAEVGPTRSAK